MPPAAALECERTGWTLLMIATLAPASAAARAARWPASPAPMIRTSWEGMRGVILFQRNIKAGDGAADARTMPSKEDIRLLWLASIPMYVFGGLTILAVLAAPDPDPSDHTSLLVMAGVYLLSGAVLWRAGPRRGLVRAAPLWGILTISATVAVVQPIGAAPFFYLWPLLGTAYFL